MIVRTRQEQRTKGLHEDEAHLLLRPERAAEFLDVGRTTIFALLRDGEIESVKVGRSRRIPKAALVEYVERLRARQGTVRGWPDNQAADAAKPDKVRKLEQLRDGGKPSKPGKSLKLAEWMTYYLDMVCENLVQSGRMSPRTLDDYRSKNRVWIVPLLGGHRLDRLLPDHLDQAYSQMYDAGLSSSTVLKVHRILSRALTVAKRRDKVGRNVATLIEPPEADATEIEPFTRAEASRILGAVKGRRNSARWKVALALGLRQGECLGLRWSYVDLDTGVVRAWYQIGRANWRHGCDDPNACGVLWHRPPCPWNCRRHRRQADCPPDCRVRTHRCPRRTCDPKTCVGHARHCPRRRGGGITFRERKGRKRLTISLPPELLPDLRAHQAQQDREREAAGDRWQDLDLVFCREDGSPISRDADWYEWKAILRAAEVRDGRLHDARHTAATVLLELGVPIRVVQEILGHARVTTTEGYTHVASPQVQDASVRMGSALLRDQPDAVDQGQR